MASSLSFWIAYIKVGEFPLSLYHKLENVFQVPPLGAVILNSIFVPGSRSRMKAVTGI